MNKSPQERKTPINIDHDHWEKIRVKGKDSGITIGFKRESRYKGGLISGPEGVRQLRDVCDAWLEHHEEEDQ